MINPVSFNQAPFNLAADEKNRLRALELSSFIVEAPAGAGKTELLTQRYLKLLQTVQAPEEIIAITFTNKAAAEMRLRILDSLIKAAKHENPTEAHKQITYDLSVAALQHAQAKGWQLIEAPACMRIFTIDSLCAHIARQMPLMSRFGAQPKVADEPSVLYAQAAENTLALLEDASHAEVIKTALRYVSNHAEQLKNLLVSMLEKRDQWLGYAQSHTQFAVNAEALQHTLRYLIEQDLQQMAQVFNTRLQFDLMPLARFAASQLPCEHEIALLRDWDSPLLTHAEALPMWLAVRQLLLTNDDTVRASVDKRIGFPADASFKAQKDQFKAYLTGLESMPAFAKALAKTKKLPHINAAQTSWPIIESLAQLLTLAVAELWLVFQQAGEVDFVEIASKATQALVGEGGEPTDLALKLDYQIKHLLVDEFQDTSPSQIELLKQLTLGWQAGDARTLFCVGDPMQSIYRFRKANVGLFIEAATHGIGDIKLERLQLYRNNRSMPAVVNWINETFAQIFPALDDITQSAIHYRPFMATKADDAGAGVEIHPVIKLADESNEDVRQREAETVINIIQQTRAQNTNASIAVLVRSKKHLTPLVRQLRRNHPDIKFQAVEIEALEGRQVVQDLLSLTYTLIHRADRVHWLAVLRAPWCGLTLQDLHKLAGHDFTSTVWSLMQNNDVVNQLSADGQQRLQHVRNIFTEAFVTQGRLNISRWLRGVWLMLGGAACLWEQNDIVDVQAFFACLDQLDRSNQFSPERMEVAITKLFATPDAQGAPLQMMTIHKSKGLEFDTVILPGLGASTGGNQGDTPLLLWEEVSVGDDVQLLAAPFIPKGMRINNTFSPYDYLADLEEIREKNEAARVLYVAATRAERKLHLVGIANQNASDETKPVANSALERFWPMVSSVYLLQNPPEKMNTPVENLANFTPQLVRLNHLQIPSSLQHTNMTVNSQSAVSKADPSIHRLEADIGTLAHQYLEIIANQGLDLWPIERLNALRPAMQHWLQQQNHSSAIAAQAAKTVFDCLQTTLASKVGQWVLKPRVDANNELAISLVSSNKVNSYVVDRTFVEDDTRWVIDYKTVQLNPKISEAEAQMAAKQHQKQLVEYAKLFANEPLPIKKAILFLNIAKLVEVE
ncbi:MAG: UvrD-helicase domain-containing protein [Methylophilaceae bacterium]